MHKSLNFKAERDVVHVHMTIGKNIGESGLGDVADLPAEDGHEGASLLGGAGGASGFGELAEVEFGFGNVSC